MDLFNIVGTPIQSAVAVSANGPNKDIIFLVGTQSSRREYIHSIIDVTGKMYLFSGLYSVAIGNSIWSYENRMDILDTIELTWSNRSQLQAPTPRDGYSATLLPNGLNNDHIIIYRGSYSFTSPVVAYDLYVLDIRFIFSQQYINPDMYILDIGNDSEYKCVISFDPKLSSSPNPSTYPSPNSSSIPNRYNISSGTMIRVIIRTFIDESGDLNGLVDALNSSISHSSSFN
ncbi:galactose oxidase [Gigaspora margarita]|uniref:Galactose oxidase n=1 Tax=Gigaspora margarita TaxID=4874 RepID=A0A8H3X8R2_GIGMA|nr:galactose oxidase [Gigaspora margarita]